MKLSRLEFIVTLAFLLAASLVAAAQQTLKAPRIGVLATSQSSPYVAAFRQGLRELGYAEGQNLVIEWRQTEGKSERLTDLATELVRFKVEVIVTTGAQQTRAAQQATRTVPIVMAVSGDPVASGFVASLARPGGNITGLTNLSRELSAKRLELLKQAVPRVSRVVVLADMDVPGSAAQLEETQVAARALGLELRTLNVRTPDDFDQAFRAATEWRADALLAFPSPLVNDQRARIVNLAAKVRLPASYPTREHAEAGGLMAYGPSYSDLFRRAAYFVDRILKGANPADLPVEQPTKFELVVNLKTAKALGLTLLPSLLLRADQVIQ